jgi:hypothetical protein
MKTNDNNTETAAGAPEAPQNEYEYFNTVAKKYLKQPELDSEEYHRRWDNHDHPATEPKLPPNEEAEYFRRIKEFRERRREDGRKIDPETAEVMSNWGETLDPYGIDPLLPQELRQLAKNHFARSPGSDIWVWSEDLPVATHRALQERHKPKAGVSRRLTAEEEAIKIKNEEPF